MWDSISSLHPSPCGPRTTLRKLGSWLHGTIFFSFLTRNVSHFCNEETVRGLMVAQVGCHGALWPLGVFPLLTQFPTPPHPRHFTRSREDVSEIPSLHANAASHQTVTWRHVCAAKLDVFRGQKTSAGQTVISAIFWETQS